MPLWTVLCAQGQRHAGTGFSSSLYGKAYKDILVNCVGILTLCQHVRSDDPHTGVRII